MPNCGNSRDYHAASDIRHKHLTNSQRIVTRGRETALPVIFHRVDDDI